MRRREFITLLGGAAAAWPLAARAQQTERMRRIGVLTPFAANDAEGQARLTAFAQGLQHSGWIVGQNIRIEYRWGDGRADTMRKYAAELVALAPDVMLASSSAAVVPLLEVTRTVPIVFAGIGDPVAGGYVESQARPGGNATGFTVYEYSIGGKWLELLKEVAPRATRIAVLRDSTVAAGPGQFGAVQALAPSVGADLRPIDVRDAGEIERAVTAFAESPNGGLVVFGSPGATIHRDLIITLAAKHRLPAVYQCALFRRRRRSNFLRTRFPRPASARRRLRRSHPQGREASRPARAGADQVRTGDQPQDRQGAWPRSAAALLARADELIE